MWGLFQKTVSVKSYLSLQYIAQNRRQFCALHAFSLVVQTKNKDYLLNFNHRHKLNPESKQLT